MAPKVYKNKRHANNGENINSTRNINHAVKYVNTPVVSKPTNTVKQPKPVVIPVVETPITPIEPPKQETPIAPITEPQIPTTETIINLKSIDLKTAGITAPTVLSAFRDLNINNCEELLAYKKDDICKKLEGITKKETVEKYYDIVVDYINHQEHLD